MKKISQFFIFMAFGSVYPQTNFTINISAPVFEKDSIALAPPMGMGETHIIYDLNVHPDKNIRFMKKLNAAFITIHPENTVTGNIAYPQPLMFSHYDPAVNGVYGSDIFFMEKGNYNVNINDKNLKFTLSPDSPSNKEYKNLKEQFVTAESKLKPYQQNSPEDIGYKQKLLQTYIKKNPDSYVAFWEIVNDFSKYGFSPVYLENMALFSRKIKTIFSYKEFGKVLQLENATTIGKMFPDLQLNSSDKITKNNFSNYKLTLIDYWATTCKPCIKDLPKLVELHRIYKNKGVQFISIADDISKERMERANKILQENNISWKIFFDLNKEFPRKLHATGYPLQILIDQNGKIVSRKMGELDAIAAEIEKYIQ